MAPGDGLKDIFTGYDRADVLLDVSLAVEPGSITCILGSNGSGKTTLIRAILGLTPPRAGAIVSTARDSTTCQPTSIIARGIACIPEGRRVFPKMTVEENLRLAPTTDVRRASHGSTRSMKPSRGSRNARGSWLAPCRAASRRCCRSAAA